MSVWLMMERFHDKVKTIITEVNKEFPDLTIEYFIRGGCGYVRFEEFHVGLKINIGDKILYFIPIQMFDERELSFKECRRIQNEIFNEVSTKIEDDPQYEHIRKWKTEDDFFCFYVHRFYTSTELNADIEIFSQIVGKIIDQTISYFQIIPFKNALSDI